MTEILHTGDTHLGYRQYHRPARREDFQAAFAEVARDAVSRDVDAVVHAGDLFHDRQPALTDVLGAASVLRILEDADIPFLGIVGNHESKRERQWLDLFEEMGLARRLGDAPEVVDDVAIYGLDFVPRSQREDYQFEFETPQSDVEYRALVAHGLFEPFDHGEWDARDILRDSPVPFDAVLLGDDHTPQTTWIDNPRETVLTYCGSTERASASEQEDRGYNLVTFAETVDVRRQGIETRDFRFVDVDLGRGEGTGRVRERVNQYELEDAVVIVTITGDGERVLPAEIEAFATDHGALVARVNDQRDQDQEGVVDVSFADPDRAVEQRVQKLGLSTAARDIDETIRASDIVDSKVADTIESRVRELSGAEASVFESVPAAEEDSEVDAPEAVAGGAEEDADGNDETDTEHAGAANDSPGDAGQSQESGEGDDESGSDSQVTMGEYT